MLAITSLTGNGVRDWLIQQISAVVMLLYVLFLFYFVCSHPTLDYYVWSDLFANYWMRTSSLVVLASMLWHGWVGIWTVTTDYLKCVCVRLTLQTVIAFALLGCFFWGIEILWGI